MEYVERSTLHLHRVFDDTRFSTIDRLRSGELLFRALVITQDWAAAYQTATRVMNLVPQLTPRSLGNSDKQFQLQRQFSSDFASKAAAVSLLAKQPVYKAIGLLELGRGIIIGSLGELRTDMSKLQAQCPILANEYLSLREQLDTPILPDISVNRHDLAKKFSELLKEIRKQPSFERFLSPLIEDEMRLAAASGPVVVINTSIQRCDALIIKKDGIQSLSLPLLRDWDLEARAANFSTSNLQDTELLEWLWDTIAEPILEHLKLNETPRGIGLAYGGFLLDLWPDFLSMLLGAILKDPGKRYWTASFHLTALL